MPLNSLPSGGYSVPDVVSVDAGSKKPLGVTPGAGQPGIGAYGAPSGNAISQVQLGIIQRAAPASVDSQTLAVSAFPRHVDLQWKPAPIASASIGFAGYWIYRRALILLGFAGAFRRSELVGLDVEDCTFGKDGLTVTLGRSKTDQDGAGRKIGIPYGSNPETCPVRTMQAWMELAGIGAGPVFRSINRHGQVQPDRLSGIDVARVAKKLAQRAGLDAAKYAGHSLRAGHATSAAIAGASERSIMNQTGHRSVQMVRRYIRDGSLFRENSAGKLGL